VQRTGPSTASFPSGLDGHSGAGYVTVDTFDWYLDAKYQQAALAGRTVNAERLREVYVQVLVEGANFYDALSRRALGRSPKHVLLLHENDLAALHIVHLVARLRQEGWTIVDADAAYDDAIARLVPDTLFLGQGRVAALAQDAGDTGPFSKWEDEAELDELLARARVFQ
jgi:hypothetical protein